MDTEAYDARGGRDTATGNTPDPKEAEVAVLIGHDQTLHAGSRGEIATPRAGLSALTGTCPGTLPLSAHAAGEEQP